MTRRSPLDTPWFRFWTRAFAALDWLLIRAVVGVGLCAATWIVLDVGMRLLIRAGAGDAWAVLIVAVIVAGGLGWAAGRVEAE